MNRDRDRATYDASLTTAVNYTVASSTDAPTSLTYGPSFFTLAAAMKGDVTVGLNRQLNNQANTLAAAVKAKGVMPNLLSIELGNEPECQLILSIRSSFFLSLTTVSLQFMRLAHRSSLQVAGIQQPTEPVKSRGSQLWLRLSVIHFLGSFVHLIPAKVGNVFQGAVYLQYPTWSTTGLIPMLGSAISTVKTFSGHSYPQSACNGASTNLQSLMSHSCVSSSAFSLRLLLKTR